MGCVKSVWEIKVVVAADIVVLHLLQLRFGTTSAGPRSFGVAMTPRLPPHAGKPPGGLGHQCTARQVSRATGERMT